MPNEGGILFSNLDLKKPPSTPSLERGQVSTGRKRKSMKSGKNRVSDAQAMEMCGPKSLVMLNMVIVLLLYFG